MANALPVLVAVAAVACTAPVRHESFLDETSYELPPSWLACKRNEDCQALQMGCCDHCSGGWVVAANTAHAERVTSTYHTSCESYATLKDDGTQTVCEPFCPETGCGPVRAECDDGRCTWAWDASNDGHYVQQPNRILVLRMREYTASCYTVSGCDPSSGATSEGKH